MGRKDTLSTEYLSDNARFADICNYCLFDGQDVIQAEDLREMDTKEFLELAGLSGKGQQIQRIRDILKGAVIRSTGDCTYLILGVENQTEIHYAMPVRGMIYDGINYGSQVNEISRRHRKGHDLNSPAKFLSGFTAEDHLQISRILRSSALLSGLFWKSSSIRTASERWSRSLPARRHCTT